MLMLNTGRLNRRVPVQVNSIISPYNKGGEKNKILAVLLIAIFAPSLAVAIVPDPGQVPQQSTRFSALAVAARATHEEMVSRLILKPRFKGGEQLNNALQIRDASGLAQISKAHLFVVRPMSGGAHVISLGQPVTLSEARIIAARMMLDNSVEFAEPDRLMRPLAAVTPTNPDYADYQWNLQSPYSPNLGGANLPNAWGVTTGSNAVVVAVLDTGYRPHADFGFNYSGSSSHSPVLLSSGYTFISDVATANNGVGWEADAQDPGDWVTAAENESGQFRGCGARNSSWHGTHVTGIIAAQMNSGIGIVGIAPNVRILPVRVLGKCGGYDSDIIDGMRWAAGIPVPNAPTNNNPAQVLNMSLGESDTACSQAYQSAVTDIINAGKVIVAGAGNDGTSTLNAPGNCTGVIAVTAHAFDGDKAWYATIGPGVSISAPGGGCGGIGYSNCPAANSIAVYSLFNSGLTFPDPSPSGDTYAFDEGTSMATAHVTGVIALMLSLDPTLTPSLIKSYLQSSARPFPPGTICPLYYPGQCGAGLLDAYQVLAAVKTNMTSILATDATLGANSGSGGGGSMDSETLAVLVLLAAGLRLRRRCTNRQN